MVDFATCNTTKDKPVHLTQKPVPLMEYLIETYTNEGETVLDNRMGSGSTGIACVNTGRNFIGIEKDPDYFTIAERRSAGIETKKALRQAKGILLESLFFYV